ncbi:MAG: CRTAC1 family protein [Pirellulaceae bacterium]
MGDVDGNGSWDVLTTGLTESRLTTTRHLDNQTVAASFQTVIPSGGLQASLDDVNNDGRLELLLASDTGLSGLAGLQPTLPKDTAASSIATGKTSALSVLDANSDGMLDLLTLADGQAVVCRASEIAQHQFMLVRVAGINDINGGGRVSAFAVGSTLEVWADGNYHARIVEHPVTHFGLGADQPDNLRIIFPNGLTQNLEKPEPKTLIEEKQIPRGSCPYAYGWDGEKFVMITDCLWNAPLGLQIARGEVLPDRRWENLLMPAQFMQPKDGGYELRITEELWEIAYFDQVKLTAIDHPSDVRVFTNEKVGPPELAEHQIFAVQHKIQPQAATDSYGRDVLERIIAQDGVVVQAFEQQICQGLCEPHYIELDFGKLPIDQHALRLFLTGWMFPTDTSLNIGIDQNPDRAAPEPPSLWVVDEDGQWVRAQPFMGFPGGKMKSIVVDLKDVFRSEDHRLRIGSSQQNYWDEAFVAWDTGAASYRQQAVELLTAELRYHGFGEMLPRQPDQPHWFDYQRVQLDAQWPSLAGPFTRYGDVKHILLDDDDRMVVMVSGDEIALRFAPPTHPLPIGWQRDFVLYSTGWDKDADLNTIQGQGSLPLPFMSQTRYPAGPEQAAEAQAVLEKNADTLTRQSGVQYDRRTAL